MIEIIYPSVRPSMKTEAGKEFIFCLVRKKWMQVTPEEWVRQNILLYITHVMQYPASLIAVEKQLSLGELKKRFDIVVYKNEKPFVLIECKAMEIPVSQKTLDQAMRYNINLQAKYFIITNGNHTYGFAVDNAALHSINHFPSYL